jgi:acetyl esterase/lipase
MRGAALARAVVITGLAQGALVVQAQERRPMPTFDEIVKMRVVYSVPGMDRVTVRRDIVYRTVGETLLKMDVYAPPGLGPAERRPGVIFVHGGPLPPGVGPKDWGVYLSYGELAAASGMVGITFNHRFYGAAEAQAAAGDVAALVDYVRANADALRLDPDRLALWAFSGGGTFLSRPLAERPPFLRALVSYYAVLDNRVPAPGAPDVLSAEVRRELSPAAQLGPGDRPLPPILIARAGRDNPLLNATVDTFVREALTAGVALELLNHPTGQHGFDILDDDVRSREIIARTFEFLKGCLR